MVTLRVMFGMCGMFVLVAAGCGPIGDGSGPEITDLLPPASKFKCSDLDGTETACVDFNDGNKHGFSGEAGTWDVVDGRYLGWGPDDNPTTCADSLITHAIFPAVNAQDLTVHAQLASIKRVDKVLVLRSVDQGNRLQINFRARDAGGEYGDVMVQEVKDCVFSKFTNDGQIPLDNELGDALDVDVTLAGQHITVVAGGKTLLDADEPITVQAGKVGVGVIDHSESMFDNFIVRDAH
ncbi:MAG TPA: hypothetical protein VGO62_01035 [Myxococcota bacterium]|jgi:hypothetical protein